MHVIRIVGTCLCTALTEQTQIREYICVIIGCIANKMQNRNYYLVILLPSEI
jgi:hypothetical protein